MLADVSSWSVVARLGAWETQTFINSEEFANAPMNPVSKLLSIKSSCEDAANFQDHTGPLHLPDEEVLRDAETLL